jgi:hypothetical protein
MAIAVRPNIHDKPVVIIVKIERNFLFYLAALRPFFRSSKFITGCISTFAPISKNGSAMVAIISEEGISIMKLELLSPLEGVKNAASAL